MSSDATTGLRIWVLRHAKAAAQGPGGDATRPLTGRGRRQADAVREHLAAIAGSGGILPSLVLCSTAARARETAERVLPAIADARLEFEKGLYSLDASGVIELIKQIDPEGPLLMVVGHNPTLHELCTILTLQPDSESVEAQGLPTACLVELEQVGADDWKQLTPASSRIVSRYVPDR